MNTRIRNLTLTAATAAALTGGIAGPALAADAPTPTTPAPGSVTVASTPAEANTVDHQFQLQSTGYYCAPAATRVALSAQGHLESQTQLAHELGTTHNGTASITQVTDTLNQELGAGTYSTAMAPDAATLQATLVNDIDHGKVLVANIAGSTTDTDGDTHTFAGGHYIAITGYTDHGSNATIADTSHKADSSGDRATTYQVPTTNLAQWMNTRGYAY